MSRINFWWLVARAGNPEGARPDFEEMMAQLVRLTQCGVRRIEANPGDWGIDVFVGMLDEAVVVWQSKFFINGVGKTQQGEIRDSLGSLMDKASEKGLEVSAWTLCIPCSMDAETTKWWDTWKKKREKEHGIRIELWDETELIGLLMSPDAAGIRAIYLSEPGASGPQQIRPVREIPDEVAYDDMLFVEQLLAARIAELDAAKQQFFNHDLLAREVADKGIQEEIEALRVCQSEAYSMWDTRFNRFCQTQPDGDQLPGLHGEVMKAIESVHFTARDRSLLSMSLVHRLGAMHQVVDNGKAGWVRSYRDIVRAHRERRA